MEPVADLPAAPPRRRGRPPRVSRDEIIAAAINLFSRRGYRGTTIVAIAEAVGVKDASILHYFDGKSAILEAALEDDGIANEELLAILKPGGIETLRRLAGWGSRMEASPETTRLQMVLSAEALMEGAELHDMYAARYRYLRRRLSAAIGKGIEHGEIRADVDALQEATSVLAQLDGLRVQWFHTDGELSLDNAFRSYIDQTIERIAVSAAKAPRRKSSSSRLTGRSA